ncbi:hypothetical protein AAMO2058_001729400 [Amorphochlora amoebiformis]
MNRVLPPQEGFLKAYNPVSSFIFAYQGQTVFLEIMSEMKNTGDWPKALWLGQGIMIPAYTLTAALGYYFKGSGVPAFLPSALDDGPLKIIISLLVAYHVLAAYLLNNVAMVRLLKAEYFTYRETDSENYRLFKHWTLCVVICAFAWLIAELVPFFGDLVTIIGAVTGSPVMFALPPLFYYLALKQKGVEMSVFDKAMCGTCFFILFPVTFLCGIVASMNSMVEHWSQNGPPFSCTASGE